MPLGAKPAHERQSMKETSNGIFHHPGLRRFLVRMRAPIVILGMIVVAHFVWGSGAFGTGPARLRKAAGRPRSLAPWALRPFELQKSRRFRFGTKHAGKERDCPIPHRSRAVQLPLCDVGTGWMTPICSSATISEFIPSWSSRRKASAPLGR